MKTIIALVFSLCLFCGCVSKATYQHKLLDIQRRLDMATKKPYNKMWLDVVKLNDELKDELGGIKNEK